MFAGITGTLGTAAYTVAGAVATRGLTQVVLGTANKGPMGYIANGAAALILGQVVGRFVNRPAGNAVMVGGFVSIVIRAVQEFTQFGKILNAQLSGLGDWSFGLGAYEPTDFFSPLASGDPRGVVSGNVVIPDAVSRVARGVLPAVNGGNAGMGRLSMGRSHTSGSRYWGTAR